MPYCEKCGNEIDEETTFCPKCGANVKTPVIAHRRPRSSGRNSTTILAIFFGGIIIIASLGILAGGGMVTWVQSTFSDSDGFMISGEVELQVDSHAIVGQGVDIDIDVNTPSYVRQPELGDFVTLKLVGTSNDPSKQVFIGIAQEGAASAYLSGARARAVSWFTSSNSQPVAHSNFVDADMQGIPQVLPCHDARTHSSCISTRLPYLS